MKSTQETVDKSRACLIMGAIGDALGAPVEFMSEAEIKRTYGDMGLQFHAEAYGHKGAITDDTQMTLMCADGLLSAFRRGSERGILSLYRNYTALSYIKWLKTQGGEYNHYNTPEDWGSKKLFEIIEKQGARSPGNTCITALSAMQIPPKAAHNNSKGCGTVMRVAPIGIFFGSLYGDSTEGLKKIYQEGVLDAAITHGHTTAQHASGILAVIIALCLQGQGLLESIKYSLRLFGTPDLSDICAKAIALSEQVASPQAVNSLGEGWVADEALAMSLYCTLQCTVNDMQPIDSLRLAVNHGGDSDSTGAITGNLIGICLGTQSIPKSLFKEDTEVGSLKDVFIAYGEELVTRPERALSIIH